MYTHVECIGKIMNSQKKVKSCVPERVSIFCPTCGTHIYPQITGNQSYDTLITCFDNFEIRIDHLNKKSLYF